MNEFVRVSMLLPLRVLDELASKHKEVFDRKLIRDAMFSVDEEGCGELLNCS